jgi:hypothetical protein
MRHRTGQAFALVIGLITILQGCSSSSTDSSKGSVSLSVAATRTTAAGVAAATLDDGSDALSHLQAATITVGSAEVHQVDGTWVMVDRGLPVTIDLLAILTSGGSASLPADLIPEGHYDSLQLTITKVDLTLLDGTKISVTPPGLGWTVTLAVDFTVVAGQETTIHLNLHCDGSFHLINGTFEFDPEIDIDDVEHDGSMHH